MQMKEMRNTKITNDLIIVGIIELMSMSVMLIFKQLNDY